jgi:uncharacterized protein (DUF433 family)
LREDKACGMAACASTIAALSCTPICPTERPAMEDFDRITHAADVMGGKACIRGMRVTVSMVVGQIAAGRSIDELLVDFPYLDREDIAQALRYAAWLAEEREVELVKA